jgi:hypothetical protein
MEYYSDKCTSDTGNLLLFMSDLQVNYSLYYNGIISYLKSLDER